MALTNKGNGKGKMTSFFREQDHVSDDEIHEVPVEEERSNGADDDEAAMSEDEHPVNENRRKRKYHYRHSQYQIKTMESYYKQCPHPDENRRIELSQQLGLHPLQVKFWFQNKRTQMKTHRAHMQNSRLRIENENLCCENMKLKENISSSTCNKCGKHVVMVPPDKHQLRLENERLRKKIEHVTNMTEFAGNIGMATAGSSSAPLSSFNLSPLEFGVGAFDGEQDNLQFENSRRSQLFRFLNSTNESKKTQITEIALLAMQEVDAMARIGEPLWIPGIYRDTLVLNPQEYYRIFQSSPPKQSGFTSESSRACAVVIMNHISLVKIFMEMNKWQSVFSGIISKAMLAEVISTGEAVGNYDGALHLMAVEFQALTPAIPTRECSFVRYCRKLCEGTWAIVDVSIDALNPNSRIIRCRRKPSGCILQAMSNDCSKITWVEHVEVQDSFIHSLSKYIVGSGYAYGAKRWVSILERQCERLASAAGVKDFPYFEDLNEIVLAHPEGNQCVLKLAERMILSFYGAVTENPTYYHWTPVSGNGIDEVRIMTRKSTDDPGSPSGLVIGATISFWIPVLPKTVFKYFRDERTRSEWDILSRKGGVHEMAYIGNGPKKGNCVSMLRVNNPHTNQGNMMILQECSTEPTASMIVYAPVDVASIEKLLDGGNPNVVQLLPSGFTMLPSAPPAGYEGGVDDDDGITKGTLLSIAFQILGDSNSDLDLSDESIDIVKNLVRSTIHKIQIALQVKDN